MDSCSACVERGEPLLQTVTIRYRDGDWRACRDVIVHDLTVHRDLGEARVRRAGET